VRYYKIEIINQDQTVFATYTTGENGNIDLGALQVEFDIPVTTLARPIGAASLKIWGVGLNVIYGANDFNGKLIKISAGFVTGLPLATAAYNSGQTGVILEGLIWQAYGNWIGTQQWVEFVIVINGKTGITQQLNITQSTWAAGTSMADAITNTLKLATAQADPPFADPIVSISPNLKLTQDEPSFSKTLGEYASYMYDVSKSIIPAANYAGVSICIVNNRFVVSDGTVPTKPTTVAFNDMIGQPTWVDPGTFQVTTSLRADISPLSYVELPTTQVTIAPSNQYIAAQRSSFQGRFFVKSVRHIGSFRDPNALSWITSLDLYSSPAANLQNAG